ncbi:MAG: carbon-nitrogen hydrolase family protein [Phycisphaerae bacterium]|nr:carbon-nitrogen hydrolase family protein [Phycisphaerae bacterium]
MVITIAALQPALSRKDVGRNLETIRTMAEGVAADRSVDLIVLPEAFDGVVPELDRKGGGDVEERNIREFIGDLARTTGARVVGGSVVCSTEAGGLANTCFVADRSGRIVGQYSKRKLFAAEATRRTPGQGPGIFDLGGLRVGVLICADLWHPELAREYRHEVDVLCVPAKSICPSSEHLGYARLMWWSLAVTRASENVLPLVVSDWCGGCDGKQWTAGVTSVNDPSGRPDVERVHRRLAEGQAGVLIVQIDLDAVAEIREYRQAVGLLDRPVPGD